LVSIDIRQDGSVHVEVLGWHVLLALKRRLAFRRSAVREARRADPGLRPPWFRAIGTSVPRIVAAGTYYGWKRKEFWDTTFGGKAVEIVLAGAPWTRIVVDVVDPDATIRDLRG
jgi:hypothetical protein